MDSRDATLDLHPSTKDALFQDDSLSEKNLESLTKLDLLQMLKDSKTHCTTVEKSNQRLQDSVDKLEKALDEQYEKCKNLEEDKSFLRNNIKKASTNWFERKAKLSESENDNSAEQSSAEGSDSQIDESETPKQRKNGVHTFIAEETVKLFSELKFKHEQLELSDRRCAELNKRLKDYEKVIDDQEVVIHGLEKQLNTYFNDNQMMSKQLADLHKLFVDLEAINEKQVNLPATIPEQETLTEHLPTAEEFKAMSGSVAKTYMKLKELIYEKKSLVTEIERLRTLNVELQDRVSQQETRLINVSDALQTTWLLVSNLKDEHEKLHTAETILRYELKEKREVLHRLKDELECAREQWHIIRQKNSETEQEWTNLHDELNERRKLRKLAEMNGSPSLTLEEVEGAVVGRKTPDNDFEPPIDLLVDMGIEYGVVNEDDEESITAIALVEGEDVHEHRLQNLEEQCCFLYQKLMTSTARALTLASRLTSLHQHYAASDEEDDENDDENEQYYEGEDDDDDDDGNIYESEIISPDSESYDTAYVSEADGADSASGAPEPGTIVNEGDNELAEIPSADSPDLMDDSGDTLSRRLITFLPRKIEILKADNIKLEERLTLQLEEKMKSEATLTAAVDYERRQRRQLEQQLSHLGKCVDELKLERNGKIAQVEEELRKKVEQVEKEEKEHIQLLDEYETLKEKYEERGHLLQLTDSQLEQTLKQSEEKITALREEICILKKEILEKKQATPKCTESCQTVLDLLEENELSNENNSSCRGGARSKSETVVNRSNSEVAKRKSSNTEETNSKTEIEMDSQLKRMIILTNSCLRIPLYLTLDSVLCWSFHVATQEIKFSIMFDDIPYPESFPSIVNESERISEGTTPESLSAQSLLNNLNTSISESKELLEPHLIRSSNSPTTGRIFPIIPGQYCLVFQNHAPETQEILLKLWLEQSSKAEILK